jgi:hypothetical protein
MKYTNEKTQRAFENKANWLIQVKRKPCRFAGINPDNIAFYDVTFTVDGHDDLTIILDCSFKDGHFRDVKWANQPSTIGHDMHRHYLKLVSEYIRPSALAQILGGK